MMDARVETSKQAARERRAPKPDGGADTPGEGDRRILLLELMVIVPTVAWLAWAIAHTPEGTIDLASFLFFVAAVMAVDLIPVPVWGGMQLSLSFPILIGVAMLYPPAVAGLIALLGSADPREFRREVGPLRALWNRTQMAIAIIASSAVFTSLDASFDSPWWQLIPAAGLAAICAYTTNVLLVALHGSLTYRMSVPKVLVKMHGTRPYEFILSYLGLGLFGLAIARFFLLDGYWSVVVFLAPLVFARQMYFRSQALTDRLADQNELLGEQAERLERLLQKEHATVDELLELNRMKGEFVAVVSHELRTPVTALIGYAKTLRQTEFAEDPAMRSEFLERMERQGERLLRLVENLLTTAKLESEELAISLGRVLFEDLCREVVEGLASESSRIKVNVPNDLPVLQTDRQLLGRIISNLLDNALKYSPDGTPCELGARPEGTGVAFWVRDEGIGIDPDELTRIFDRFYQVDSSTTRKFRGAGLGLSMVRDLVAHLGGRIEVESTPGAGSLFTVHLPETAPASASIRADLS
jgi:signal transduction histidine kinase